jgi:hypothetical protein
MNVFHAFGTVLHGKCIVDVLHVSTTYQQYIMWKYITNSNACRMHTECITCNNVMYHVIRWNYIRSHDEWHRGKERIDCGIFRERSDG